ncbi:histidine kinase [Hymenobacter oligotrophus]|uniref:Histidine kinase n=1 Tax=Hymenobacter oligotrophus TaxID=2319843 RepID=A0A3B7R2U6_9BACT|nr:sensor histidine kinase [Hymenobacter oligotrophus]AYA35961.1 histidine kinase [Hymenobacter oligotrophus]
MLPTSRVALATSRLFNLAAAAPARTDWRTTAGYWLVVAPVLLVAYLQIAPWPRALAGTLFSVLLDTATVYGLLFGLLPQALAGRWRQVALLALGYLGLMGLCYHFGFNLILRTQWPLSPLGLLSAVINHARSYALLGVVLAGKRYYDTQQRYLGAQKAQAESELRRLKAQLDPHFLFNNLNVLGVLILRDPSTASDYLRRFAALYRYLIRHKDDYLVPLADELAFAEEYLYLLRQRFGEAYVLVPEPAPGFDAQARYVVPGTLQLLIENAIKHNCADDEDPLIIRLQLGTEALTASNLLRPKPEPPDSTGTGLANLAEQYRWLTERDIEVTQTAYFSVTVPLVAARPTPFAA